DILNSVDPVASLSGKTTTRGRLNVYRAVTNCAAASPAALALTVSPGVQRLDLNSSVDVAVTATSFSGANLAGYGIPFGVTAKFTALSVGRGTATSTLTLTAGPGVTEGTFLIGIAGTSGAVSRTTGLQLTVGSSPLPINVGQTISGTLSITD